MVGYSLLSTKYSLCRKGDNQVVGKSPLCTQVTTPLFPRNWFVKFLLIPGDRIGKRPTEHAIKRIFLAFFQHSTSRPFPRASTHGSLCYLHNFVSFIGLTNLDRTVFKHNRRTRSHLSYDAMGLCEDDTGLLAAIFIIRMPQSSRKRRKLQLYT